MDYPIRSSGQLSAHLRALRKARGLSQARLGEAIGVGQTRVARIERDPTGISVDQFLTVLGALGAQMVLRSSDLPAPTPRRRPSGARRKPTDEPW